MAPGPASGMANGGVMFEHSFVPLSGGAAPALLAPGRAIARHAALRDMVAQSAGRLGDLGLGGRVIALMLPNGPEMAVAFLAASHIGCAAPLNPAYGPEDLRFYLRDLGAAALICTEGISAPARAVARELGVRVIALRPVPDAPAGGFTLHPEDPGPGRADLRIAGDHAVMLHTSGTTARPKLVGLARDQLRQSIGAIKASLALGPQDRGLCVMPLFHIHGLMAGLCAPLAAGGSVVCTPGFDGLAFFRQLAEFRPSWYSAVPSMHRAILGRVPHNGDIVAQSRLRFVRSSSAALPVGVLQALEQSFGCPVIEAYGMTEAAHQICTNALDAGGRRAGSVGRPGAVSVAILDPQGQSLGADICGEIALRGPSIHGGYIDNPAANAAAFADGWFRTGDEGRISADGFLTITGRLKEIINRGGEKISPLEIDSILADHPDIQEAVAFAIPHAALGEDLALALVARPGSALDPGDIRRWLGARVAAFKVPRQIRILDSIPKGPTGKVQRLALARQLGFG